MHEVDLVPDRCRQLLPLGRIRSPGDDLWSLGAERARKTGQDNYSGEKKQQGTTAARQKNWRRGWDTHSVSMSILSCFQQHA
jgi:hypothetical protein